MIQHRKAEVLLKNSQYRLAQDQLHPAIIDLAGLYKASPNDQLIRNTWIDALLLNADLQKDTATAQVDSCKTVQKILQPILKNSEDFQVLAPWVKAHSCLNETEKAQIAVKTLDKISYRDPNYLHYISTHPLKR